MNRAPQFAYKGEHEVAIADFTDAIKLNRNCGQAYRGRAFYTQSQKYEKAVGDYSEAIRIDAKDAGTRTVAQG